MRNLDELHDDELLEVCFNNQREKFFSILYQRHYDKVFRYSLKLSEDKEFAEDLAQDVFEKTFSQIDKKKLTSSYGKGLSSYLLTIVYNSFVNSYRKNNRFQKQEFLNDSRDLYFGISPSPEEVFIEEESKELLKEKINSLKYNRRESLLLSYFEDLKGEEIAERLGVEHAVVRGRIFRAKNDLRSLQDISFFKK